MAKGITCNPVKLSSIVAYLQKSRVAHNIKDLEKHLPSVASINGMQVKDYLQALSDENKIRVEKIGSGNWYWSFASEDKKLREKALENAQSALEKAEAVNNELKQKIAEAEAQRKQDEADLDDGCDSREDLLGKKALLSVEVQAAQKELAAYSDNDPTELERKKEQIATFRVEAEQYTDEIYCMESWFQGQGIDATALKGMKSMIYGGEYNEEEGMLKDLD